MPIKKRPTTVQPAKYPPLRKHLATRRAFLKTMTAGVLAVSGGFALLGCDDEEGDSKDATPDSTEWEDGMVAGGMQMPESVTVQLPAADFATQLLDSTETVELRLRVTTTEHAVWDEAAVLAAAGEVLRGFTCAELAEANAAELEESVDAAVAPLFSDYVEAVVLELGECTPAESP